jgi:paraquat-inducible protein B
MTEQPAPPVAVKAKKGISLVWVVPIVAALVGAFMAWRSWQERGIPITIRFQNAEGLEANKTKVLYKAVQIGLVDAVELAHDLKSIEVRATIDRDMKEHLRDQARFWVVRPRVGLEGISGLGTLLSGAQVAFEPGSAGKEVSEFVGLESPPLTSADTPGLRIVLEAGALGSIGVGSPILFRDIQVGQVEKFELLDAGSVEIDAFIAAPHDKIIRVDTAFWNASGLDVTLDANGLQLHADSLRSMLLGGITFTNRDQPGEAAKNGARFRLFGSHQAMLDAAPHEGFAYVAYFSGSVRGLSAGAPVEFRGVKVGEVTGIRPEIDAAAADIRIAVFIDLRRSANPEDRAVDDLPAFIDSLVAKGLRAQLQTGSLLTGQMFVALDFHQGVPPRTIGEVNGVPELPTVPSAVDHAADLALDLLTELKQLPLAEIAERTRSALAGVDQLVNAPEMKDASTRLQKAVAAIEGVATKLDGKIDGLAANVNDAVTIAGQAMEEARMTLTTMRGTVAEDSPLHYELSNLLRELTEASRSIRVLASYLERHPDAVLYGKPDGSGE